MRILSLLATPFLTGPAELALEDGEWLRGAGHELLFGADTKRPGNYCRIIRERGFPLMEELALCAKPSPLELMRDVARLRARMRGAQVVHCRFPHEMSVALAARAWLAPRPALVRTVEIARALKGGGLRSRALRACDALVVSCTEYARRLEEEHGVERARIHILPGRVDSIRFAPTDASSPLRAELGVRPDQPLFGIVSRMKVERLHSELLRAFARLKAEQPAAAEAHLALIGRGEYRHELERLVEELGLGASVHFAGYRKGEQLVEAYRALDVKVWLAEGNDGTCRAVLEAMACGVPVIAARSGAMADIVRDGRDGVLIDVGTPDGEPLVAALARMLDGNARRAMGWAARERALEYTQDRRAKMLLGIYEAAVSAQSSSISI